MKNIKKIILIIGFLMVLMPVVFADTIFYDGFESTGFSTEWTITDGAASGWFVTDTGTPSQGNWYARATNTDTITTAQLNVSTVGYSSIVLSFDWISNNVDAGEYFTVEWYNGTGWLELFRTDTDTGIYNTQQFALPDSADDNINFSIRFNASIDLGNEDYGLDEVRLEGNHVVIAPAPGGDRTAFAINYAIIFLGLFFVSAIFLVLTTIFNNELQFFFMLLTMLSVPYNLKMLYILSEQAGVTGEIIRFIDVSYIVSLWLFAFIFFYSMIKITMSLRVRKKKPAFVDQPRMNDNLDDKEL